MQEQNNSAAVTSVEDRWAETLIEVFDKYF